MPVELQTNKIINSTPLLETIETTSKNVLETVKNFMLDYSITLPMTVEMTKIDLESIETTLVKSYSLPKPIERSKPNKILLKSYENLHKS